MVGGTFVSVNLRKGESLTSIDSLSDDLLFNILLLLPAQDVFALRLVCRKWYHTTHAHNFTYAHLQRTTCGLLIQELYEHQNPTFMVMRQGRIMTSKFSYNFRDNVMASCNGLILEYGMEDRNALYIANPVTKQQLALPVLCGMISCGMGYAEASMEYKVVATYVSGDVYSKARCAILTVGVDNSWRHVDLQHLSISANGELRCISLITEGYIHWYRNGTHVSTLNVETETITDSPVPRVISEKYCLSAGKHLSLLIRCSTFSWESWKMKPETGEWTKLPNIDMEAQKSSFERLGCKHHRFLVPVGWLSNQEVLVFDSLNPVRACIAYNVRTQEIDSFKLASYGRLYIFKVHRNSLVRLGK